MFVVTCLAALVLLAYVCYRRDDIGVGAIVDRAASESAMVGNTVFVIHDRSTETVCDRLVVVRPFDWYVWACRGHLYILNPEGGIRCSQGHTPAVQVYADDHLVETCMTMSYEAIRNVYAGAKTKTIPYKIEGSTFTVLTALELLAKKWITFDHHDNKRRRRRRGGENLTALQSPKNYLTSAELANAYSHLGNR